MALISVNGLVTRYKIVGKGSKTILLLHGWGASLESFASLQRLLARRFRVVALDLPGFGETDLPPKPWTVEDYTQFVKAFIQKMQLRDYHLAGYSFGGRIAITLAASPAPGLKRLILIASAGIRHKESAQERAAGWMANVGRRVMSLPLIHRLEPSARFVFYKIIRRSDYYLAQGIMKETMRNIILHDVTLSLSRISVPMLLIWGENDTITPLEDARTMQRIVKRSKLVIIKDGSHYLPRRHYHALAREMTAFIT